MRDQLTNEVLDKITKVCTCKSISRATIKKAIFEGANTIDKVIEETGACKGNCKGSRCKFKIEDLINKSDIRK